MNTRLLLPGGIVLALLPLPGFAVEIAARVGYSGEFSDNSTRIESDTESERIDRPYVSVVAAHDTQSLKFNVDYRGEKVIHEETSFQDNTFTTGKANLTWLTAREVLTVDLTNERTRRTLDSSEQNTEENREVVDQSSAAATFRIGALANHFINLTGRYETVDAERSATASDRHSVRAIYNIPWPNDGQISFSGGHTSVDFEDPGSSDYHSNSLDVSYLYRSSILTLDATLGNSKVEQSGRDSFDQFTGRIELSREFSRENNLSLVASKSVEDNTLDNPSQAGGQFRDQFIDNSAINEIFVETDVTLGYGGRFAGTDFDLSVFSTRIKYKEEGAGRDEDRRGYAMRISRRVTSAIDASLSGFVTNYEYPGDFGENDDLDVELQIDYQANRKLSFGLSLGYYERETTLEDEADIDTMSIIFSVDYILFGDKFIRNR